ncbi:MAG: hydantoinase B/oxoprolinase family protein [Planctomycetales bacterium]|nr:hydantoinase B/oxoprolinase family protein [Planctomycetales bacterium]
MSRNPTPLDPITLEIMRHRFGGITEEMAAALVRTAYSTNIKDRRDCSAALALPDGQILAQAEVGTPLHLGIMPSVIASVLREFPISEMRPGDVFITNLPYPEGPGHLPDVSLVSAVFADGRAVALAASTAHHVDMGGFAPGSMPFGVTEIYQEGLQIPPTRIFAKGNLEQPIFRLINQNVRTRNAVHGDLMAQFACAQIAQRRVAELFARYADLPGLVESYMCELLDYAERRMRAGIATLPDGVYEFEDFLDDDGVTDTPVRIFLRLTIAGDEMTADFTGTADQVLGPLNARLSAAKACVYYAAKAVVDPDLPTCAGAYRPLHVLAPEGSLLEARFPAAIGNANIVTDQRVVDVLMGALNQAAPERVCAACSGEMNLLNLGGIDPRSGEYYNYVETYAGGQGAFCDQDGEDGVHTHLTNTRNAPVEVIERSYPLEVVRYGLVPDSEGPGEFRGGCGMLRELRCLGERTTITIGADRRKFRPWGLAGGQAAAGAHCFVTTADGTRRELPTKVHATLAQDDRLLIQTPGGGGWGDPAQRDVNCLAADVAQGLITADRARQIYDQPKPLPDDGDT